MTRRFRLQLEAVNPLAVLAMLSATLLGVIGKVPAEAVLAAILGIAVPGHTAPPAD